MKFFSALHQFVASRNDCDSSFAADHDIGETLRGQQCQLRSNNSVAFPENFLSFAKIAPALSHKLINLDICVDDDLVAITGDVFLHHDRICAGWHWRAGKNSDRVSV